MRVLLFIVVLVLGCGSSEPAGVEEDPPESTTILADVVSLTTSGQEGSYTFSVGIESTETGCEQYADWWEILSPEGNLIYRRVLAHSHVNEQPFIRSGGPVPIAPEDEVIVRAHMNTTGYGGQQYEGSVQMGFEPVEGDSLFARDVAQMQPLPSSCAF